MSKIIADTFDCSTLQVETLNVWASKPLHQSLARQNLDMLTFWIFILRVRLFTVHFASGMMSTCKVQAVLVLNYGLSCLGETSISRLYFVPNSH